jgi:hypothetical protein
LRQQRRQRSASQIRGAMARALFEVPIILTAINGVAVAWLSVHIQSLTDILQGYCRKSAKGNNEVRDYLRVGLGIDALVIPSEFSGAIRVGWGYLAFITATISLTLILFLLMIVGSIAIHFLLLRDIYMDPSFNLTISKMTIAFVAFSDITCLATSFLRNPDQCGQRFQGKADSNPVIADSR